MSVVFVVVASVLLAVTGANLLRLILGRTVYDRLLAAGVVGTNAVVLLAVVGFIFERPDMFVDLAITYALLNFLSMVAAAKYLERHGGEPL